MGTLCQTPFPWPNPSAYALPARLKWRGANRGHQTAPLAGLGFIAVDHLVDVGGNARRLIAVLTRRLCDSEHLRGEADKRHRDLHLARHIEPEAHVLWHPRLAWLVLATHQNFHDAPGCHRILLRVLDDALEGGLVETALPEPTADLNKAQVLDSGQHRHGVLDELGIAELADVKNRFAHRLEYRLMLIEQGLGARNPKRQLPGRRDLLDAAGRSVDDGPALLVELTADVDDGLFIDAAEIDPNLGAGGRLDEPTLAEANGPDRVVVRQHRKHELARFGHCFGRVLELCAFALQSPGLLAPEIVHDQAIAGLDQVGRHAAAHAAGANETHSLHASHLLSHCPTKPNAMLHEGLRWGCPRASILSCVFVAKSLASWRSCNCSSGGPLARLTIRPRLTAGRSPISFVQRVRFLYSRVCRNLRGSL